MTEEEEAEFMEQEETISYEELLSNLILNGEMIITIPQEMETPIKNGLKNHKSRQNKRMREEGLPADTSTLEFLSYPSKDYPDCVDLRIELKQKAVIKVKKIVVPSDDFL